MKLRRLIATTMMTLMPLAGFGQTFRSINFPTDLCAGADTTVSFGYSSTFNIIIDTGTAALSLADRAFLPDGVPCGNMGCSYQSTVTFSDFTPGATITSAQDIEYVRLNMEHSFIGDIYIGIVCPNGTRASLMNWSGNGSSQCRNNVPQGHRSWTSGTNASGGTYLGEAYDYDNSSHKCDSTAESNEPGIGWNYCWSSNTTSGYQYKPGDALLYRSANTIQHYNTLMHTTHSTIDSSNVAAGTGFYHPQDNFSTLAGCPLNGQWAVEVIDAYSQDNGYIFEWEMALNPSLIPNPCPLEDKLILSDYVQRIDDTTFLIHAPDDITSDTTVLFTLTIINSCGDTIDSTVGVRIHTATVGEDFVNVCDSYTFGDSTYTSDDTVHAYGTNQYGCDSMTVLHINVNHSHDTLFRDTVTESELPYVICGYHVTPQTETSTITIDTLTVEGCDSTINVLLTVGYNVFDTIRDTVCRHTLPYLFDSLSLSPTANDMTLSLTYRSWLGADSTITLMLHINDDDTTSAVDTVVEDMLPHYVGGVLFAAATDTVVGYTNRYGCDSTVHYRLHVWYNVTTTIDSSVCRHQLPVVWNGMTIQPAAGDTAVDALFADRHGADSTVTLMLHVDPDYDLTLADTTVENRLPVSFGGAVFHGPADTTFGLTTVSGCDSTVHYRLHVWYNDTSTVDTTLCRHQLPLLFHGHAFAPTGSDTTVTVTIATAGGADSTIVVGLHVNPDSHTEVADTVVENQLPASFGDATFYRPADTTFGHTNRYGCDSTVHYRLHVWYNMATTMDTAVCANHFPVGWHGVVFDRADTVVLQLHTIHGADSTVTLRMRAYPVYDTAVTAEICDNQSYTIGHERFAAAGHHEVTLVTTDGCDSLVRLDLTVWPTYAETFTDTVCATSGIDFDGTHYMYSGSYTHHHPTVHGCDSMLTLNLTLRGLNLRAQAQVAPLIPTPTNLDIELRDVSRAAIGRTWYVGDIVSSEKTLSYTYPEAEDSVEAVLIAYSNDECADTSTTVIRIDRSALYAPNAFTPGQPPNSHWQLVGTQVTHLEVWIYNRQGNMVARYTGIDGAWDGTDLGGRPCQQGAYVFKAEYQTKLHPERMQTMTGTILLIR